MNETNDLITRPIQTTVMVAKEETRAIQEVQAALVVAKRFPRDTVSANTRITEACKRKLLAEKAMYAYPRGGQTVTGISIRLAEVMAQNYGNLDFGIREIEQKDGRSVVESFCWDLETNTKQTKVFEVPHEIQLKGGVKKKLTDPRDIYELVANMGARRMRSCILGIIPIDVQESARIQVHKTLKEGGGEPISDRIKKTVVSFSELGVTQEMLEKRLGHEISVTTADEIVELIQIHNTLKDKQADRGDFFEGFKKEEEKKEVSKVMEKIKSKPTEPSGFNDFKETKIVEQTERASVEQMGRLLSASRALNITPPQINKMCEEKFKVKRAVDLTSEQADALISELENGGQK